MGGTAGTIQPGALPLTIDEAPCFSIGIPRNETPYLGAENALRYGRVLLYLEDIAALDALVDAVEVAYNLREEVFGASPDLAQARVWAALVSTATANHPWRFVCKAVPSSERTGDFGGTASAVSDHHTETRRRPIGVHLNQRAKRAATVRYDSLRNNRPAIGVA
jgi:hypothetical protein